MLPSFVPSIFLVVPLTLLLQRCGAADGNTTNDLYYKTCSTSGNFSNNSPYQFNLALLLATLPSNAINNSGSFNGTAGSAPNVVFGAAMCQADIPWPDQCNSCLQAATAGAASACPSSKNASAVYRGCVFQYSDTLIAAVADTSIAYITQNHAANVPEIVTFQQTRTELFTALSGAASVSPLKLASSNRTFNGTHTLYGLAQCNRYLPADECSKCIKSLVTLLPATVLLSEGVSVTGFSCYIRYDLTPFGIYNPSATAGEVPVAALHNLNDGSRIHQAEIIGILVSVSIIVLLAVIMVARHYIRKRKLAQLKEITGLIEFSYHQIKQGTESFNEETNKLGEGGFGQVYKGKFHIEGEEMDVAVKRVTDQTAAKQLLDELSVLAKLVHKNVVQLVGFCSDDMWSCFGKKKFYICNELMSNGSLDKHIFFDSEENGRKPLSWSSRYEIIRGICEGLQYIHGYCNKKISHMDIKPSNILLDEGMVPKIADFGLSRVFKTKDISQKVTQNVIGSQGYIAPEYINHGIVGRKCDIYSLGILILAIVMGTGPQGRIDPCGKIFINDIRQKLAAKDQKQLLQDAFLGDGDCLDDVKKCIALALKCVEEDPNVRPTAEAICIYFRTNDLDPRYVGVQIDQQ